MAISRRVFMKSSALAVVGISVIPSFLTRASFAQPFLSGGKKRLVVLFGRTIPSSAVLLQSVTCSAPPCIFIDRTLP